MKLEIDAPQRPTRDIRHDRLLVLRDAHRTLIALADGSDSGAASQAAAALTVRELARCFRNGTLPDNSRDWEMVLQGIDLTVFKDPVAGETSALVLLVQQNVVVGASVGDSLAYTVPTVGEAQLLTARYRDEPRIGTGMAAPIGFGPVKLNGKLITRRAAEVDPRGVPFTIAAAEKPRSKRHFLATP
ncbi:MAG: protein phosphatase 2C domain-containing protein [Myxococcales bacterium]|nr:protein phosphatase 2C domain-containing protein [Myxococcales bacterium]MDH3842813.1 protein phosphatase 2C domain-containing protein [Myxococcales bacterium]